MMIGNTHDETRSLIGRGDPGVFDHHLGGAAAAARGRVARRHLRSAGGRRIPQVVSAIFARRMCSSRRPRPDARGARAIVEAELRAAQGSPGVRLPARLGAPRRDGGKWGAFHTLDIPLMFGTLTARESLTGDGEERARVSAIDAAGAAGVCAHAAILTTPDAAALGAVHAATARDHGVQRRKPAGRRSARAERRLFAKVPFIQQGT